MEITVTGANALAFPALAVWDWRVSLHLFFTGAAAGMLALTAAAGFRGMRRESAERMDAAGAALLASLLMLLGMFFLWLDLERKSRSSEFFLSFSPSSPMFWGGWGMCLMVPVGILYGLSAVPDGHGQWLRNGILVDLSRRFSGRLPMLARTCLGIGVALGLYTGLALSAFVARPLWDSPLLPVLFLVSALSNGAALIVLTARTNAVRFCFTKANIWLISPEIILIIIFFFFGHLTSAVPQRESVRPFFDYTQGYFFFGLMVMFIAFLLPLALAMNVWGSSDQNGRISGIDRLRMQLSAALVLAGGFLLKHVGVVFGQLSRLSVLVLICWNS
ncbi:MAG: polysulfide reductase NrfD [Desulfobacteraceae bacterium]|nr:polysulfide reductase NrfD [Desulfobacteraceae bacterium]